VVGVFGWSVGRQSGWLGSVKDGECIVEGWAERDAC